MESYSGYERIVTDTWQSVTYVPDASNIILATQAVTQSIRFDPRDEATDSGAFPIATSESLHSASEFPSGRAGPLRFSQVHDGTPHPIVPEPSSSARQSSSFEPIK
jgi:hypothetical protein